MLRLRRRGRCAGWERRCRVREPREVWRPLRHLGFEGVHQDVVDRNLAQATGLVQGDAALNADHTGLVAGTLAAFAPLDAGADLAFAVVGGGVHVGMDEKRPQRLVLPQSVAREDAGSAVAVLVGTEEPLAASAPSAPDADRGRGVVHVHQAL